MLGFVAWQNQNLMFFVRNSLNGEQNITICPFARLVFKQCSIACFSCGDRVWKVDILYLLVHLVSELFCYAKSHTAVVLRYVNIEIVCSHYNSLLIIIIISIIIPFHSLCIVHHIMQDFYINIIILVGEFLTSL